MMRLALHSGSQRLLAWNSVFAALLITFASRGASFPAVASPAVMPAGNGAADVLLQEAGRAINKNNFAAARELIDKYLRLKPGEPRAFYLRGKVFEAYENYPAAIHDFNFALKNAPQYAISADYASLANAYLNSGNKTAALATLNKGIAAKPSAILYKARATMRMGAGDLSGEDQDLKSAIKLEPGNRTVLLMHAQRRESAGDLASALADYTSVISYSDKAKLHDGNWSRALKSRMKIYEKTGKSALAQKDRDLLKAQSESWEETLFK